jgi:PhzF family phenazine biosynthesis protein
VVQLYHIDSFTDRGFGGAAAPVMVIEDSIDTDRALSIAVEFNQPVMTFLRPTPKGCEVRFFETKGEVGHVGHAALAAGHVALARLYPERHEIILDNPIDGALCVQRKDGLTVLDFTAMPASVVPDIENLDEALGEISIVERLFGDFGAVAVLSDEEAVRALRPDIKRALTVPGATLIVTARGREADFVSRVFAPKFELPEDPVCGTAHRILVPYWAGRLGRPQLTAHQVSQRGGYFQCELRGDRVRLGGCIAMLFEAQITLPQRPTAAATQGN